MDGYLYNIMIFTNKIREKRKGEEQSINDPHFTAIEENE